MGGLIELPDGPSGRAPITAVSLAEQDGVNPESHLVLFEDGSMGVRMGENPNPLFGQSAKSFDSSEYSMVFYSPNQFGKIEKSLNGSRIPTYLLRFTVILFVAYLALFLYYRTHLQWPTSLYSATGGYLFQLLFIFPLLIYWAPPRIFDFSAGEIKVYPMESDPHVFPISSETVLTINTILLVIYALLFGCIFAGELYCDLLLLVFVGYTVIGHITGGIFEQVFISNKEELMTAEVGIEAFCNNVDSVMRDLQQQERIENPLLNLLMDNESPTLEFKASLWTKYHGVTGEIVEKQENKMLELEDSVVKTVAAFLNTAGGTLLIGVKDKPRSSGDEVAEVLGIKPDFKWLKKKDTEGYQHALIEIFRNAYSNPVASHYITTTFPKFEDAIICRIDAEPLPRKVGQQCYTNTKTETKYGKKELLFTRISDTTENMSSATQYGYIRHHFDGYSGENNQS